MADPHEYDLEAAKARIKKAKPNMTERQKQLTPGEEPEHLVSGQLDELELKRRQRGSDDND